MVHRLSPKIRVNTRATKALLACGAVLGLGTAATLAAWSDDVWVTSSFVASQFNVQGSVDGSTWEDYNQTSGVLQFTTPLENALIPGATVYAPLSLRVAPGSTHDAAITLTRAPTAPQSNAADIALFQELRVQLYSAESDSRCRSGITENALPGFEAEKVLTTNHSSSPILNLTRGGSAKVVCLKIRLKNDAAPAAAGGSTGAMTWEFRATSI